MRSLFHLGLMWLALIVSCLFISAIVMFPEDANSVTVELIKLR